MSEAHTDAVLALLETAPNLNVHDATVPPGSALPYVVLFTDDGLDEANNLEAQPDTLTVSVTVTASGLNRTAVQRASGKAHDALVGVVPTVSGRSCSVIRHINSRKIDVDKDVTPHLLYAVNEYQFYSVPA
jgi:hypothetical protein